MTETKIREGVGKGVEVIRGAKVRNRGKLDAASDRPASVLEWSLKKSRQIVVRSHRIGGDL